MIWDELVDLVVNVLPPWGSPPSPTGSGGSRRRSGRATVPDVHGWSFDEARVTLSREGFKVGIVRSEDRPVPVMGIVVDQSPAPGTRWRRGKTVTVTVHHPRDPAARQNSENGS